MIYPVLFVLLGLVALIHGSEVITNPKLMTAGDPTKFKADPTIITTKAPLPAAVPSNVTAEGGLNWVMYKQCDSRWANQQLGTCALTICSAGCAMSSVAMMLATKGTGHNPSSLDVWLTQNGGYAGGCNIYWGSVDAFGVTRFQGMQVANEQEICNGLAAGHGIVANVNGGGHWVLLTGCRGGGVFSVNDPGYSRDSYGLWEILQEAVYH